MQKITHRPRRYHDSSGLPLFDWADRIVPPPLTMGGRLVRRRTGLPPRIANAVADLAGIGAR
jgi:hypothetical protein